MLTEQQNPKTMSIDNLSTLEMVTVINEEDAQVALAVQRVLPAIAEAVDTIAEQLASGGRLFYIGAGTSGRLGILDAVECVPTYSVSPELVQGIIAGGHGAIVRSVEGAEDSPEGGKADLAEHRLTENDVVVGIAASGRTPYVLGAIEYAKSIGSPTIGIACNVPSALLDAVDLAIGVAVGAEVVTGSTRMKAGTAQKMVMNMLSTGSMIKLGKVYGNLMVDVQVTNQKLADRAKRIIMQIAEVDATTAEELLQKSDKEVKTAIVMHKQQVNADEARQLLSKAKGRLREVIG